MTWVQILAQCLLASHELPSPRVASASTSPASSRKIPEHSFLAQGSSQNPPSTIEPLEERPQREGTNAASSGGLDPHPRDGVFHILSASARAQTRSFQTSEAYDLGHSVATSTTPDDEGPTSSDRDSTAHRAQSTESSGFQADVIDAPDFVETRTGETVCALLESQIRQFDDTSLWTRIHSSEDPTNATECRDIKSAP